jgi:hypothetical protein
MPAVCGGFRESVQLNNQVGECVMASDADNRAQIRGIVPYQYRKGQSGNPKGRPKGARSRLSQMFLQDVHDFWRAHGPEILMEAVRRNPVEAANLVAKLVPKGHGVEPPKQGVGFQAIWERMGNGTVPHMDSPADIEEAEVIDGAGADAAADDTTMTKPR